MPKNATRYDATLAAAVRRFQERHGRERRRASSGRRRSRTSRVPPADRCSRSSSRWSGFRWLPAQLRRPLHRREHARVPAAGVRPGSETARLSMGVVVGSRPRERTLTPILQAHMRYVIFRPTGRCRTRSRRRDPAEVSRTTRAYLGRRTWSTSADASGSGPGPATRSASSSSSFRTPIQMYLHDTPSKELFRRSRRDFSHGCIRGRRPCGARGVRARPRDGWDRARIVDAMKHGANDRRVEPRRPVPIYSSTRPPSWTRRGRTPTFLRGHLRTRRMSGARACKPILQARLL